MEAFVKSFISLFVAIDAIGVLPFLMSLTKNLETHERKSLINRATISALAIGVAFVLIGKQLFSFLGITDNDFKIAGGSLLLIFAIRDLLDQASHQGASAPVKVGIVPIAIPLIMGPASLTTLLVGADQYGILTVLISLAANLALVWILFSRAYAIIRFLGDDASDAVNKVFSLLMAAIGVMFIRSGIMAFMAG